jgi:hypothetical protein
MRCYCCNKILSDFEATRKSIKTNEYLDMCNKCYNTISEDLLTYERSDLYDEHEDSDEEGLVDYEYTSFDGMGRGIDMDS